MTDAEVNFTALALCYTAAEQAKGMGPGSPRDQVLDASLFWLAWAVGWRPWDGTKPSRVLRPPR